MKNQIHPEFKGARRSRRDPATVAMKSKDMGRKGYGRRPLTSTSAPHSKTFGH
jgi:hypothetical protein